MNGPVRLRFAPSPNGLLHLGHALSALLNDEAARRLGGQCLVRIEDIDQTRSTENNIASLRQDLGWLGLTWPQPEHRQSQHLASYAEPLEYLKREGLVYRCFASRNEIAAALAQTSNWPFDPDGTPLYPGLWRGASEQKISAALASGLPFAWRLDMARAVARIQQLHWVETGAGQLQNIPAHPLAWGDVILARKDIATSYHLAVVIDDAAQHISHVVRGRDLYHATSVHRLLQELLGLPAPLYHHHRLLLGPDGRKLSKSQDAMSLKALRDKGTRPRDILQMIGWDPNHDLAGLKI